MSRACPKCHRQRQPTDHNPDWRCPSCQIAYNKVVLHGDVAGGLSRPDEPCSSATIIVLFREGGLGGFEGTGFLWLSPLPGFSRHGIEYQELDIDRLFDAQSEFKRLGGTSVPLFVIEGEVVTGWSEASRRPALRSWLQ